MPDTGDYAVILDVWERHITAHEDPDIREIALGGPDTATRTQVVAQVKLIPVKGFAGELTCGNAPDWPAMLPQRTGRLRARAHPEQAQTEPCLTRPGRLPPPRESVVPGGSPSRHKGGVTFSGAATTARW